MEHKTSMKQLHLELLAALMAKKSLLSNPFYTSPPPPLQESLISKDAYSGSRQDLAMWKKRALKAEAKLREIGKP